MLDSYSDYCKTLAAIAYSVNWQTSGDFTHCASAVSSIPPPHPTPNLVRGGKTLITKMFTALLDIQFFGQQSTNIMLYCWWALCTVVKFLCALNRSFIDICSLIMGCKTKGDNRRVIIMGLEGMYCGILQLLQEGCGWVILWGRLQGPTKQTIVSNVLKLLGIDVFHCS